MERRVILAFFAALAISVIAGCGESADKADMIDAPTVTGTAADSGKARGLSDEEIARQKAMDGGAPR